MMDLFKQTMSKSIFNVQSTAVKKDEKKFLKYKVVKPKGSKNLLKQKSPETRMREKKEYEAKIE